MAHEIIFDEQRGINPIAFTGQTPWHGLGQQLQPGAPLTEWATAAGMDFTIAPSPSLFLDSEGLLRSHPNRLTLYRADNFTPLSIVSDQYKVVQPAEVLDFFSSLVDTAGFRMNTAGVLFAGKKYWALAEIGESARIMGQDRIDGYLLLATACDGTLATTAMFTSVRVVCNNTLSMAVYDAESGHSRRYLKIPHSRQFNPDEVKSELGLAASSFNTFIDHANELAKRKVSDREVMEWLVRVFGKLGQDEDISDELLAAQDAKTIKTCFELYKGAGMGSDLKSADGTAWGLVNSITQFADHKRKTRTADNRLDSTWFGSMANLKQRAWDEALKLAA